jgi:hypothetical protein
MLLLKVDGFLEKYNRPIKNQAVADFAAQSTSLVKRNLKHGEKLNLKEMNEYKTI